MSRFKVGDRVIPAGTVAENEDFRGKPGVVREVRGDVDDYYWVEIFGYPSPSGPHNRSWGFSGENLELDDPGPTDEEIVALFNVTPCKTCGCSMNGGH